MESKNFEFQKWPVYQEAIVIAKEAHKFCLALPKTGNQSLGDQFRRASQSIVLNIAEGSSRSSGKDKINFLRISKGSAFECAAVCDLAKELELMSLAQHKTFQDKLANVGRMLSGMIRYWENNKEGRNLQTGYAG